MKASELFARMAGEMDGRWAYLDLYRQELENLLNRASRAVGTHDATRWNLHADSAYNDSLPGILHATIWIFTTCFLEAELRRFASALGRCLELPLDFRDLAGTWADRFRKYVVGLAELPLNISDEDWQDVKGIVEIRNCLVHSMGELQGFSKRSVIEAFCSRNKGPEIRNDVLHLSDSSSLVVMGVGGRLLGESYDTAYHTFLSLEAS